MKKIKVLAIFMFSLVMLGSVSVVAQEVWEVVLSNQKFMVDGKEVKINALNINGYNYAKIADIAEVLDINITYNEKENTVIIDKNKEYDGVNVTQNDGIIVSETSGTKTSDIENSAYEVFNYDEFIKAIESTSYTIVVKSDIDVTGDFLLIDRNQTVIIEEGVTLNIIMPNFNVHGQIINNGTINVSGRILFYKESSEIGNINTIGRYGEICYNVGVVGVDEIDYYLKKSSIYTTLNFVPGEKSEVIIDKDLTIEKGKTLWLNIECTLVVSKGATLTIKGNFETHCEPIVHGKVDGKITVIK